MWSCPWAPCSPGRAPCSPARSPRSRRVTPLLARASPQLARAIPPLRRPIPLLLDASTQVARAIPQVPPTRYPARLAESPRLVRVRRWVTRLSRGEDRQAPLGSNSSSSGTGARSVGCALGAREAGRTCRVAPLRSSALGRLLAHAPRTVRALRRARPRRLTRSPRTSRFGLGGAVAPREACVALRAAARLTEADATAVTADVVEGSGRPRRGAAGGVGDREHVGPILRSPAALRLSPASASERSEQRGRRRRGAAAGLGLRLAGCPRRATQETEALIPSAAAPRSQAHLLRQGSFGPLAS